MESGRRLCRLKLLLIGALLLASYAAANQDPWKVLGVRRSATKAEITKAFRQLSKQWHPDKNSSPEATEKFQQISAAYELLNDPTKARTLWEAPSDASSSEPYRGFTATFGTVQYVLDLDPNRLRELLTAWTTDWAGKNWQTFGPLWHSPVDHSVCWCMENAWRLPRLTEPASKLWAGFMGTKHREGFWRAWRLSGALLEFSSWSSRQAPCFQHHLVNSTSTAQEVAAQLQQQLLIRRKARQAALEAEQRRKNRKGQPTSATDTLDNDRARGEGGYEAGSTWQGFAVWASVLVIVAGYSITRTRVVTVAPLVAAAGVVCYISNGVLLPDEAYVQHLASVFDADGMHAVLAGGGFVLFSMAVGLLLPLLLAAAAFVTITWVWAAATTLALASTPIMSQCGLALWFVGQAYFLVGGGDPIKFALLVAMVGYGLMKVPGVFKWWFRLLIAPVVLGLAFAREVLRGCGLWWPAPPPKTVAAPPQAAEAAEQAAAAAVQRATAASNAVQAVSQAASIPVAAGAAEPAASSPEGPASGSGQRSRSGSSSSKKQKKRGQLLPDGPWWPKTFGAVDLAASCYWYTSLLGWHLATQALGVAAISCKLTVLSVLLAVTSASLGVPFKLLTLQTTVRLLLLRGGVAAGLLWKLLPLAKGLAGGLQ